MPLRPIRAFPLLVALVATSPTDAAPIAQPASPAIAGAWVLNPALTVQSQNLPDGTVNAPYAGATLTATGGILPYTWSIAAGSLPPGPPAHLR